MPADFCLEKALRWFSSVCIDLVTIKTYAGRSIVGILVDDPFDDMFVQDVIAVVGSFRCRLGGCNTKGSCARGYGDFCSIIVGGVTMGHGWRYLGDPVARYFFDKVALLESGGARRVRNNIKCSVRTELRLVTSCWFAPSLACGPVRSTYA